MRSQVAYNETIQPTGFKLSPSLENGSGLLTHRTEYQ